MLLYYTILYYTILYYYISIHLRKLSRFECLPAEIRTKYSRNTSQTYSNCPDGQKMGSFTAACHV